MFEFLKEGTCSVPPPPSPQKIRLWFYDNRESRDIIGYKQYDQSICKEVIEFWLREKKHKIS